MIVSFLCKCLAFISDETQAERPIGLRMSAYANSEDREVVEYYGLGTRECRCFFGLFLCCFSCFCDLVGFGVWSCFSLNEINEGLLWDHFGALQKGSKAAVLLGASLPIRDRKPS